MVSCADIASKYDHTSKWLGIVVELHGNKDVLDTGAGGLMFTVDGKQSGVSPSILEHSPRQTSWKLTRCTVTWNLKPGSPTGVSGLRDFISTLGNAHEVYVTLFPGENSGGKRFTAQLTDEQLQAFRDTLTYYDTVAPLRNVNLQQ